MTSFEFEGVVTELRRDGSSAVVEAVHAGQAIVAPRGVWHGVEIREPSRMVHITPGPGGGHRPL